MVWYGCWFFPQGASERHTAQRPTTLDIYPPTPADSRGSESEKRGQETRAVPDESKQAGSQHKQIEGLKLAFEGLKLVLGRTARRRPAARTSKLAGSQQCRRESQKKFELSSI